MKKRANRHYARIYKKKSAPKHSFFFNSMSPTSRLSGDMPPLAVRRKLMSESVKHLIHPDQENADPSIFDEWHLVSKPPRRRPNSQALKPGCLQVSSDKQTRPEMLS